MPLIPDKTEVLNGVTVKTYLLTQHNPNKISMPTATMSAPLGVTIHNTEAINVASNTTPAEQYTRATVNGNMNSVRVHFYVDDTCAWQNLPLTLSGWHAADGSGNGNRKTIAFEVIGNSKKAEENAAKLAAYFIKKFGKTVDNGLFTHTYWLNVRDGKKGSIDTLNVLQHYYKRCPIYIIPHWSTFKATVAAEFNKLNDKSAPAPTPQSPSSNAPAPATSTEMYRIRKSWADAKSQIGAFTSLDNAKKALKDGYSIFDSKGNKVYPTSTSTPTSAADQKIDVTYRAYAKKTWWPEVKNLEDYAGVAGNAITGVAAKSSKGTLRYRVHQRNSNWMNWIEDYNINDLMKGFAGVPGIVIDAIQIELKGVEGYQAKYRVQPTGGAYTDWAIGAQSYAGVLGKSFDKIQIEIVKE